MLQVHSKHKKSPSRIFGRMRFKTLQEVVKCSVWPEIFCESLRRCKRRRQIFYSCVLRGQKENLKPAQKKRLFKKLSQKKPQANLEKERVSNSF